VPVGREALLLKSVSSWPKSYVGSDVLLLAANQRLAVNRRRGRSPEDSQDLVQGFFEHLIGSRGLATVDRSKGRFRSFLLASFLNFITAETRRARAEKRGGRAELIRLDWRDAEERLGFEPEDQLTAETLTEVAYY
jgi:DNA-directed RNA polymerase specialized sigma24 family protein